MAERTKERRKKTGPVESQAIFEGAQNTDVIIPVIGKTGVGKSTFINTLLGKETVEVGDDQTSCTTKLQWEVVNREVIREICPWWEDRRRVIIVDTPGFDGTFGVHPDHPEGDLGIRNRVEAWRTSSYGKRTKFWGIIYLQNIANKKIEGSRCQTRVEMFKKLVGSNALKRVMLVTTGWDEVKPEVGEKREKELKDKFWQEMIKNHSTVARFHKSRETAYNIVRPILERFLSSDSEPNLTIRSSFAAKTIYTSPELEYMRQQLPHSGQGNGPLHSFEEFVKTYISIQPSNDMMLRVELDERLQGLEDQVLELEDQIKPDNQRKSFELLPFFTRLKWLFRL